MYVSISYFQNKSEIRNIHGRCLMILRFNFHQRALVVKGKALYLQGNFEGAMVLYHRALHVGFASNAEEVKVRQIIDRATETINNSLGTKQAASVFLLMPKMLKR